MGMTMFYQDLCQGCKAKSREQDRVKEIYNSAVNSICETLDNTGFSAGDVERILNDVQRKIRREKEASTITLTTASE